jgi:predicted acyl esterase
VASSQYGLPGRSARGWGSDSLEGVLTAEELAANRADQHEDAARFRFRDEEYYRSREFDLSKIKVPLLSAVNWGAIHLHLRGSVLGYLGASSEFKYLYFLTGRHDLPFFYDESVDLQRSFLDACLKGEDREGWLVPGKKPSIDLCIRKGNPGFSDPEAERKMFPRRQESEWPLARTQYVEYHLHQDQTMTVDKATQSGGVVSWEAPGSGVRFRTLPAKEQIEITGHPMARLSVAAAPRNGSTPTEIDLFLTIRHYDQSGKEIFYTGASGDPVPVVRGWLRVSLRKLADPASDPLSAIMPVRNYFSTDVQEIVVGEVYTVDVEIWPTSVVLEPGETLELEVSSSDSEHSGIFGHDHPEDRPLEKLLGYNELHLRPEYENFLRLPVIPEKSS